MSFDVIAELIFPMTSYDRTSSSLITLSGRKDEPGEVRLMDDGTNKLARLLNE